MNQSPMDKFEELFRMQQSLNERIGGYDRMMKLFETGPSLNAIVTLNRSLVFEPDDPIRR